MQSSIDLIPKRSLAKLSAATIGISSFLTVTILSLRAPSENELSEVRMESAIQLDSAVQDFRRTVGALESRVDSQRSDFETRLRHQKRFFEREFKESKRTGDRNDLSDAASTLKRLSESNPVFISRAWFHERVNAPEKVARGARIVPGIYGGKAFGVKLYAIRPNSVFAKLGMKNGDLVERINGRKLGTLDAAFQIYESAKEATSFFVDIKRRGKRHTLVFHLIAPSAKCLGIEASQVCSNVVGTL